MEVSQQYLFCIGEGPTQQRPTGGNFFREGSVYHLNHFQILQCSVCCHTIQAPLQWQLG